MEKIIWKTIHIILVLALLFLGFYMALAPDDQTILEFTISVILFILIAYLDYTVAKKIGYSTADKMNKAFNKLGKPFYKYSNGFFKIVIAIGIVGLIGYASLLGYIFFYSKFASPPNKIESVENVKTPVAFSLNDYTIHLPQGWSIKNVSDQHVIVSNETDTLGFIKCPIPEQGFEAWDFQEKSRSFEVNDIVYGIDLWVGETQSADLDNISLVFMHRGAFNEWYKESNYQHSCFMQFNNLVTEEESISIFEDISIS